MKKEKKIDKVKEQYLKEEKKNILSILYRYLFTLLLGMSFWLIYLIFTPLTFYPAVFILGLFTSIYANIPFITANGYDVKIVEACVAGSAYYLLFLLNFLTPKIKFKKRMKILLFTFGTFFILNIARIIILTLIYINSPYVIFDITHKILWYGLSTIFVVVIWLTAIKIYKISEVPIYSDFKFLVKLVKGNKSNR